MNSSIETNPTVEQDDSFFVQNVSPGHHYVTDMKLHFEPYECKDLHMEDPKLFQKSRDLRKSLTLGTLIRVTRDEADQLLDMEIALIQAEQQKEMAQRETRTIDVNGKQIVADSFDAARAGGSSKGGLVSTAGFANDHNSYAQAFQTMRESFAAQGRILSAREFGEMTNENPDLVRNVMKRVANGSWSGNPNPGRATFAVPSNGDGDARVPASAYLSNVTRDQRLAGSEFLNIRAGSNNSNVDLPYAEEIDVLAGDDDDEEGMVDEPPKGAVKRKN